MKYTNNIKKITQEIINAVDNAGEEIGITELANMQSNTPVKTGALKRSLSFKRYKESKGVKIEWGSNLIYSAKVEYENKSYLRATLRAGQEEMIDILKKHLKGV